MRYRLGRCPDRVEHPWLRWTLIEKQSPARRECLRCYEEWWVKGDRPHPERVADLRYP
jgi:hypothetical protein